MTQPVIEARDVTFRYNQEAVLENVSFEINQGEFVGIIGPNGSGKTTLLKVILGLLKPDQGKVKVLGKLVQVGQYTAVGYIPQRVTQLETRFPITVEEVVALGRVSKQNFWQSLTSDDKKAVDDALTAVNLLPYKRRLITDLSGGQQQRVFIAKALASNPKILILDEPTVGIDIESQESFYYLLTELNKKQNLTIVIVSHDVDVVVNEVGTVLCLNKHLVYHGKPREFIQHDYLKKLYGEHRKFVFHAH